MVRLFYLGSGRKKRHNTLCETCFSGRLRVEYVIGLGFTRDVSFARTGKPIAENSCRAIFVCVQRGSRSGHGAVCLETPLLFPPSYTPHVLKRIARNRYVYDRPQRYITCYLRYDTRNPPSPRRRPRVCLGPVLTYVHEIRRLFPRIPGNTLPPVPFDVWLHTPNSVLSPSSEKSEKQLHSPVKTETKLI